MANGSRLLLALALSSLASGQALINEVLYRIDPANSNALKTHQWVELFNAGAAPVDLTGWIVAGRDGSLGSSARNLPSILLPPQAYLVVHFTQGANRTDFRDNTGDAYTQDTGPLWSQDMDEAALYSPAGIVDFISWATQADYYNPGTAHNDAVRAGIWTRNAALSSDGIQAESFEKPRRVDPGMSIGRDENSTDTDTTADFEPHGGVAALDNSPNRRNLDQLPFVFGPAPAASTVTPRAASPKKWTVMLYLNGANSLESYIFDNMVEISALGGSDNNVNFVAMFKGTKFRNGSAVRGRIDASEESDKVQLAAAPDDTIDAGAQDMGNPFVLQTFINWAKSNYPAQHYAIILSSHGNGWKRWGPDQTVPGTRAKGDYLYMGEFTTALAGQHFDLLAFDACLMGGIEVADQVRDFTDYFLASEELVPGRGFPYNTLRNALTLNPDISPRDLGSKIVDLFAARYQVSAGKWTLSLTDEKQLGALISQVDTWSAALRTGSGVFLGRDNPWDNVQVLIKFDRIASQVFGDTNFVDLYDLAKRINDDPQIPGCVKAPIPPILASISGPVVLAEQHSPGLNAHGLHIYFPTNRKRTGSFRADEDYDFPTTRQSDGNSRLAIYASNNDQLPLKAMDQEDHGDLNPRTEWPEPPSPNLMFVQHARWARFLERFYHPVADNRIVMATAPNGDTILPKPVGGGDCQNPMDEITAPLGSIITLSGAGSSDADQPGFQLARFIPPVPFVFPTYYFWDLDASVGCTSNCIQPFTVPPGSDAGAAANDNMDADRDIGNTTWDEKDASGPSVTRKCDTLDPIITTLIPWDDNHLQPFHRTLPDANYVHPQTDSHQSVIKCAPLPYTILIDEPQPTESANENQDLVGDLKAAPGTAGSANSLSMRRRLSPRDTSSGPSIPNYPLVVSTSAGSPPITASGTAIPPGSSATIYTDLSGSFSLQVRPTAPGPARITVKAPGGPTQTLSFTVGPAVQLTNVGITTPPGAQLPVNGTGTFTIKPSNNGQPAVNVPVHLLSVYGNVKFLNGTLWARGLGSELLTDGTGTAQFQLQGVSAGAEQIIVSVGAAFGPVNLTVTGTAPSAPTGVGVLSAPDFVDIGQQASITAVAVAGSNPFPGAKLVFEVVKGHLSFTGSSTAGQVTITTDATGQAKATFAANDPTPIQIKISVQATQLSTTVDIPVRLPVQ